MGNKAAVRRGRKNEPAGKVRAQETGGRPVDESKRREEEARVLRKEEEARLREEEEKRRAEEEEKRRAEEERRRAEEEKRRAEEEARLREEEEERLRIEEEEARLRRAQEERERKRREEEERLRRQEEERRRREEEEEWIESEVQRRLIRLREREDAKVVVSPKAVKARRWTVLSAIAAVLVLATISVFLGIGYDKVSKERDAALADLAWYRSMVSSEVSEEKDTEAASSPEQTAQTTVSSDGIRRVYLTFDDGPTEVTDRILDILAEYDVRATFFVLGRDDEASRERYLRIVDEGHTLAMHSFDHDFTRLYASLDSFSADTLRLRNFLYDVTDGRVWAGFYRFPGGSSTTTARAEMSDLIDWLDREGITYFDWNVYGGDDIAPEAIVSNVKANVTQYDNAMILMHDGADKEETVEALPEIIEYLQGLEHTQLLPITEDTVPVQHGNM